MNPLRFFDPQGLKIKGEYFIPPELTITSISYSSEQDYGDFQWDVTSMWRNGWVHLGGKGVINFTVHCIDYDNCGDIRNEWFADREFDVYAKKTFEIRQNLAGFTVWAYKITELKLEIEALLQSRVAEYTLDPTSWCIFSFGRFR
ncbi:MAG: hypothetical protein ACN4GR_10810 [Arenicellales bacterium]